MPFVEKITLLSSGKGWIVSPSLCLWWSGKDQPSVSAAQGERGRTKSMLDWGELKSSRPTLPLRVSNESFNFEKAKSNQYQCQKRQRKIQIIAISLFWDQTTVTVCRVWITFSVYCAISWQRRDLKHQITGSYQGPWVHLIWQCFYWQRDKSQRSCL